jgi:hypothetical protein
VIKHHNEAPVFKPGLSAHEDETLMRLVTSLAATIVVMTTVVAASQESAPSGRRRIPDPFEERR